jgi:hypothetical protein
MPQPSRWHFPSEPPRGGDSALVGPRACCRLVAQILQRVHGAVVRPEVAAGDLQQEGPLEPCATILGEMLCLRRRQPALAGKGLNRLDPVSESQLQVLARRAGNG